MLKKITLVVVVLVACVMAAGIYRFNFTNDDIYIVQDDGQVVPLEDEHLNIVMLTLFSLKADSYWSIRLPDSGIKVPLTDIKSDDDTSFASGTYRNGDEQGRVNLDYHKILPLSLNLAKDDMIFVAPFSVSGQGSGMFWYLGMFRLNTPRAEIHQIDTFFLGDRIKLYELKPEEPFNMTSSLLVSWLKHSDDQGMAEMPREIVARTIKVSANGFDSAMR